jgi:hypothetical protein
MAGQCSRFPGEILTSQGFESTKRFCSSQQAINASVDMSRFLQGQTSNDASHQTVTNNFIPCNPSQGTFFHVPRITPLRIPNIGRTDFGPDTAPSAIVPDNIQAGQIAMQFGQHGQKHPHFSEESYSVR